MQVVVRQDRFPDGSPGTGLHHRSGKEGMGKVEVYCIVRLEKSLDGSLDKCEHGHPPFAHPPLPILESIRYRIICIAQHSIA